MFNLNINNIDYNLFKYIEIERGFMVKLISTSALAKEKFLDVKLLFEKLEELGLIETVEDNRILTSLGEKIGAEYKNHKTYGKYIAWPENIELSVIESKSKKENVLSSTVIGKHFNTSANKINFILSELGWIEKHIKGWHITSFGLTLKGVQKEDTRSGIPFVVWPIEILESKSLKKTVQEALGTYEQTESEHGKDFRGLFEAKYRSTDGHYVRSKAEMLIDNWLYMTEITHAYERKLPVEEDLYCDFYLPKGKVYLEYWGYDNDEKYLARKTKKLEIYKKYNFNLIELIDADVENLDDVLPRKLLKFNVQAY